MSIAQTVFLHFRESTWGARPERVHPAAALAASSDSAAERGRPAVAAAASATGAASTGAAPAESRCPTRRAPGAAEQETTAAPGAMDGAPWPKRSQSASRTSRARS